MIDMFANRKLLFTRRGRRLLAIGARRRVSDQASFRRRGIAWTVPTWDEYIAKSVCADGSYDTRRRDALVDAMRTWNRIRPERDLVIDIGANFGSHTLPFAREAGCRVLAIEPVPYFYELLRSNVRRNGLADTVRCHRAAISRRAGVGQLVVPASNGGGGELAQAGREPTFVNSDRTRCVVDVNLQRLDVLLHELGVDAGRVAFVWSDTQGCETDVIASGGPLWEAGVPLYAELWPRGLEHQGGVEEFVALAQSSFNSFIEAGDLEAGRLERRPMSELSGLVEESGWRVDHAWQSDVLLLRQPPSAAGAHA